jgi:hypothetical protein
MNSLQFSELERLWKEAVEAKIKIISWNLPGVNEEYHE